MIHKQNGTTNRNDEITLISEHSRAIRYNSTFEVRYSDTKQKKDSHVGMSLVPADCNHLLARDVHSAITGYWITRRD